MKVKFNKIVAEFTTVYFHIL